MRNETEMKQIIKDSAHTKVLVNANLEVNQSNDKIIHTKNKLDNGLYVFLCDDKDNIFDIYDEDQNIITDRNTYITESDKLYIPFRLNHSSIIKIVGDFQIEKSKLFMINGA